MNNFYKGEIYMKIAGIVLIIFQVLAFLGGAVSGVLPTSFFGLLGFFSPSIIAIILLISAAKKNNNTKQ